MKFTTEDFIQKATEKHKGKYTYEGVVYKPDTKLKIFCTQCQEYFFQNGGDHLRGAGHSKCRKSRESLTTEEFIKRAKNKHGEKYDYSKTIYTDSGTKVEIFCNQCKSFFPQNPQEHMRGSNCPQCSKTEKGLKKRTSLEKFIEKATSVHGDKYDYSKLKFNVLGDKGIFICKVCKKEFIQNTGNHLTGNGCPYCANEKRKKATQINPLDFLERAKKIHHDYEYPEDFFLGNSKVKVKCKKHGEFIQNIHNHLAGHGCMKCARDVITQHQFLEHCKKIHNNFYDYSKVVYSRKSDIITVICPTHGEFRIPAYSHYDGARCHQCARESQKDKLRDTVEDFIEKANKIHFEKYDYSKVDYINQSTKVTIICPSHGEFQQRPDGHLEGHGCRKCVESEGEKTIRMYLEKNSIEFETQKTFPECRHKQALQFDFYLPKLNKCIEFDGIQHFQAVDFGSGIDENDFKQTQLRDTIKNLYCETENIPLLRIKYNQIDRVEKMLEKFLS